MAVMLPLGARTPAAPPGLARLPFSNCESRRMGGTLTCEKIMLPCGRAKNMPKPPRITVLPVAAYAKPKRGENKFCAWKNPRGAPAGMAAEEGAGLPGAAPGLGWGRAPPAADRPV